MPAAYELQLERPAQRALRRLPARDYQRLERAIDSLADEPRPRGAQKLAGQVALFRLRAGEYRVIYAVFDVERLVKIVDLERRTAQSYRGLRK